MTVENEIKKFINEQNALTTLRFITCGSVDDGKSTLLGRLLYEAQLIFEDQIESLVKDSKKIGTQGEEIDFALLVDGLAAEREQGITIDVAYRFFSTEKRKFIVADSPGHEEYTRNMVTASSTADLAIILIDARKGVLEQTKRHSYIADLVGIKHIIVAVNKMDLVEYDEHTFKDIVSVFQKDIAKKLNFSKIEFIPISALKGDNIIQKSKNMPWINPKPIMQLLEDAELKTSTSENFLMYTQQVLRPNLDFRGFSGLVASGNLKEGDNIGVADSNQTANIKDIYVADSKEQACNEGDAVTLVLDKEIDISRGDLIFNNIKSFESSKLINANLVWLLKESGNQSRNFLLKIGNKTVNAKILRVKHKVDINNLSKSPASKLNMNEIGECEIALDDEIHFTSYKENKTLGSFILIDKIKNLTVATGVINFKPRKSDNVKWELTDINQENRSKLLGNKPKLLWFTGLSGAGKSTIANQLEIALHKKGILTYMLDGDNLRHGLNQDLGFSEEDRIENLRRVGEVAKLFIDAGIYTIASFISPFRKDRDNIRAFFPEGRFLEIYVKTNIEDAVKRDPKGLYKKALKGDIPNFTGINSPYEEPLKPDLVIDTSKLNVDQSLAKLLKFIEEIND